MDYQQDEQREQYKWIRKVKFVKRTKKMIQKGTELDKKENFGFYSAGDDVDVDTTIHLKNKTKSKRLTFKNKKKPKIAVAKEKVETIPLEQNIPFCCLNYSETDKNPSKRPLQIYEYGCNRNVYKFLAFSEGSIPKSDTEKEDFFSDSSNEQSSYKSEEEPDLYNFNDIYNYKIYNLKWKEIINLGVIYELFLPVYSNSFKDVNKQNVMRFLKTKHKLRYERLKWHPDKMKPLLFKNGLWNEHTERIVTHVFQVINDLYQNI